MTANPDIPKNLDPITRLTLKLALKIDEQTQRLANVCDALESYGLRAADNVQAPELDLDVYRDVIDELETVYASLPREITTITGLADELTLILDDQRHQQ